MSLSECRHCRLHKNALTVGVPSVGDVCNGIMALGEAPGDLEDKLGKPFIGPAGMVFTSVLKCASLGREDIIVANAARCRPPKNRKPWADELEACSRYWKEDVERFSPLVLMPMGNIGLTAVMGLDKITKHRGRVFTTDELPGVYILPTYHPAYLLRKPGEFDTLVADFRKAKSIVEKGGWRYATTKFHVCRTVPSVQKTLQMLVRTTKDFLAFDTETTGLNPRVDQITCVTVTNKRGEAHLIPLIGYKYRVIWSKSDMRKVVAALKKFFESDVPKSGQNAVMFDQLMLLGDMGIKVRNIRYDSMLLKHTLDENSPHALENIMAMHTNMPAYKNLPGLRRKGGATNVEEKDLYPYAMRDSDGGFRSTQVLRKKCKEAGVLHLHDEIELPMARVMAKTRWHGVLVDQRHLDKMHREFEAQREVRLVRVWDLGGGKFNVASPRQLQKVFFTKLGLPIVKHTDPSATYPEGQPSLDQEALVMLAGRHKIAQAVLDLRAVEDDMSRLLKGTDGHGGLLNHMDADGYVHPDWKVHGTVTGRLSNGGFNIQGVNRPDEDDEGHIIDFRRLFIPDPGYVMIGADYKQLEMRIMGYVAKSRPLIKMCEDPANDIHVMIASLMYRVPLEKVTKKMRSEVKAIAFGLNYGRHWKSIGAALGISDQRAEKLVQVYFRVLRGVREHFDRTKKLVATEGVVTTVLGRKRRLTAAPALYRIMQSGKLTREQKWAIRNTIQGMYRQAVNMTIQSPAGDMFSKACIRIDERFEREGIDAMLLINHHDAWIGQAKKGQWKKAAVIVREEMEAPVPELDNHTFPVDMEVGTYWGDNSIVKAA